MTARLVACECTPSDSHHDRRLSADRPPDHAMTRKSGDWPSAISPIDPSIDAPVTAIRWGHLYRRLAGAGVTRNANRTKRKSSAKGSVVAMSGERIPETDARLGLGGVIFGRRSIGTWAERETVWGKRCAPRTTRPVLMQLAAGFPTIVLWDFDIPVRGASSPHVSCMTFRKRVMSAVTAVILSP